MSNNYGTLSSDYDAGYDDGYEEGRQAAMKDVHEVLSGVSWSPDTFDDVAMLVTKAGFTIEEPAT